MSIFALRFIVILIGIATLASYQIDIPSNLTENPLTGSDTEKIAGLANSVQASEWLGPLAPIAISPFFGITLLAGISQFGGEWISSNSFVSTNPVLNNPAVFWIFLGLTVLTSVPRFTKVSKPAAQAIDVVETYAAIITIIVIRIVAAIPETEPVSDQAAMVVQMGMFTFSADVLFGIIAIINIIVINTIKFFFEVMVWLVPFPFIDAGLELANKTVCLILMAIYTWSPLAATVLNLILFSICLIAFRWVNRRVHYVRSVLWDPIWAMINPRYGKPNRPELVVYPQNGVGQFPAKTKLFLQTTDTGWQLVQSRFLFGNRVMELSRDDYDLTIQTGFLLNNVSVKGDETARLSFSKRYSKNISQLSALLQIKISNEEPVVDLRSGLIDA